MNYYIKLAVKNLSRHRIRSLVSVSAITFGVLVVVFARGYVIGITEGIGDFYVQYNTGHIRITESEYRPRERLLTLIHPVNGFDGGGVEEMIAEFEALEDVKMAVPRIKFGAMATYEDDLIDMIGWGVDTEKELLFTQIANDIAEGRMPNPGERGILMGSELLRKLSIGVGDRVTIVYNTAYGSMGGSTFEVTGRIQSGLKLLNEKLFYLPIDIAQELLYMEDEATELLILNTGGLDATREVMPKITSILDARAEGVYEAVPWYNSGTIFEFVSIARRIYAFIYIFIVILASFVVFNTMIMIISERKREIGMMGAMGMGKRRMLRLFMTEGALKGLIGSLIGALLGGALTYPLSISGIDFGDAFEGASADYLMSPIIYPHFSISNMIVGFLIGFVVVCIAVYIPSRSAASLNPTDALRDL